MYIYLFGYRLKLESRLPGEISITSDDTTIMADREEELKNLLIKVKEESEKVGLKLNIRGEEPRWQRSGTGRTLSPLQIHQKSI